MRVVSKTFLLVLVYFFAVSFPLFAETISGKVEAVDPATGKLTIAAPDSTAVWVNAGADLFGVTSLNELKPGDTVTVEFNTDSEGNKEASSVSKN